MRETGLTKKAEVSEKCANGAATIHSKTAEINKCTHVAYEKATHLASFLGVSDQPKAGIGPESSPIERNLDETYCGINMVIEQLDRVIQKLGA